MKLINFLKNSEFALGIATEEGVVDIGAAAKSHQVASPATLAEFFDHGDNALPELQNLLGLITADNDYILKESALVTGPAVVGSPKIICVGLNYRDHVEEMNLKLPAEPLLFSKFANSLAASGQNISIRGLTKVDYESELAVVVGAETRDISVDKALDCVLGYANANDLSERELQFRSSQWLIGKSLDGFLPLGPYLVTKDEIPDPDNLRIRGWMNGELRQNSNTSHMNFSVAELISYASRFMTLSPGDVIATGTPPGVISGTQEKLWMKDGDTFDVQVEGLGRLSNRLYA